MMKFVEETPLEEIKTNTIGQVSRWIKKAISGTAFRVIVSATLLLVVISRVDFHTVGNLFYRLNPFYFSLSLLILFADRFLMAFKWNLLLQVKEIGLSVWQSFRIYLISNFFGVFLPTTIGGDMYRIYHTSNKGGQTEEIAASVILERFIGAISSALFAVIGFVLMIGLYSHLLLDLSTVLIIFGFLLFSLILFWISIQQFTLTSLKYILGSWGSNRFVKKWFRFHGAYLGYRQYKKALLVFFLFSVVEQAFFVFANYLCARAINLNIGLIYFFSIIPISQILKRMPISINSIGVQEGLFVFLFSRVGISVTEAFSLAILARIGLWLVVLPGAILYLTDRARQKKALEYPAKQ
jgi:hypothetical protein